MLPALPGLVLLQALAGGGTGVPSAALPARIAGGDESSTRSAPVAGASPRDEGTGSSLPAAEIPKQLAALNACGPAAAGRWRELEARFERWAAEACTLAPDPARCLEAALGERVLFLRTLPAELATCHRAGGKDGASTEWGTLLRARQPVGADVRLELAKRLAQLRSAPAGPPTAELQQRIDGAWDGALELAQRHCALLGQGARCDAQMESYLFSLLVTAPRRGG